MIEEKPNVDFTVYITPSEDDELARQAIIHTKGVRSHHARACLRHGLEYFRQMERNKIILEKAQDAHEVSSGEV